MKIILASKSPARKKLLSSLGLKFEVIPAEIDEDKIRDPLPSRRVKKLAVAKARAVFDELKRRNRGYGDYEGTIIVAADTLVYLPKAKSQQLKAKFIGKPKDRKEAKEILTGLSGTTHWLYTGVCVLQCRTSRHDNMQVFLDYEKTKVIFRKLSEKEITDYVKRESTLLYAGGYTIEKGTPGASFIKKIRGSATNVLGLPIEKLRKILNLADQFNATA